MIVVAAGLLTACNSSTSNPEATDQSADVATESQAHSGTVSETMNSGGYTYVLVDDGDQKFWAAAPVFAVSVGEAVSVPAGMPMQNYHSRTLDRDFDLIYFAESILVGDGSAVADAPLALPPGHPEPSEVTDAGVDFNNIRVAEGGHTINEIYTRKAELGGQEVTLRGKVVKYNPGIMGTNWLHIQDGTGEEGSNDLTVTTDATVNEGDTVLITGILGVDRDLGGGYFYAVIVENAEVAVE